MANQLTLSPQEKPHFKKRLLWFFAFATLTALFFYFLENFLLYPNQPILLSEIQQYYRALFFVLPLILFITFLLVLVGDWSEKYILTFEVLVSLVSALILTFLLLLRPFQETRLFPIFLLLLCHAVFVPCRTWGQAILAMGTLFGFIFGKNYLDAYLSQTQKILLSGDNGSGENSGFVLQSLQVGLVGLLSVWITYKLGRLNSRVLRVENRIGNYEIIKEVGAGGMGKVYLTKHLYMGRLAAIKVLEAKTENLESSRERFEQEVKLSAKLTHPNTIILYDFGTTNEGKSYYVMEWLEGLDLKRLVEQYGPLSPARAIYILTQVCASLGEAHSQGVIHRDIKPGNIFITHRGGIFDFVKVLDFGLAKKVVRTRDPELTQEGLFLGTPLFVAPEIIFDKNKLDGRTDIYMLGCCAYWILTGHAPFNAKNDEELILAHANFQPDPISKWRQDLPSRFEEVIFRCLEKLPQDRYQSVEEFSEALLSLSIENPWSPEEAQEWWQNNLQPAEATFWEMIPADKTDAGPSETGSVFPIR